MAKMRAPERDLLAAQAARVAAAVEVLLVGVDDLGGIAQEGNLAHHLVSARAVLAHDLGFIGGERSALEQDGVGGGDLADVVQEGAARDDAELLLVEADLAGQGDGVGGDAAGVAFGLGVAQVQRVAHGLQRDVVTFLQVVHGGAQTAGAEADDLLQVLAVRGVLLQQAAVVQRAER